MWKVLKPLNGYGYLVGTVTEHIRPEDIEPFLRHQHIEAAKAESTPEPTAKKSSGKKNA